MSTQRDQILNHLQKHGSITPMEALRRYGCFRLGARIWELKKKHRIESELVSRGRKHFARYSLV